MITLSGTFRACESRDRTKVHRAAPRLIWIGLVLAVAAYGAVVVRNITETMVGIVHHDAAVTMVGRPNR